MVQQITAAGGKAIVVQADVAKLEDVQRLVAEAVSAFGAPDILVNNAGVYEFAPLDAVSAEFSSVQHQCARTAADDAGDCPGTSVRQAAASSSAVTELNPPESTVYAATKSTVNTITRVLAKELGGRKIRVNCISPGLVETEGTHAHAIIGSDFEKLITAQKPRGRIGQPQDVAKIAVFLASEDAGWVSGEVILASGGMR